MSRHKLVKALDLDDELADYDGISDEDVEEELSPEDKESLRIGLIDVRKILGSDNTISDKAIEDSLYYYYYDVPKTVNYLLNQSQPKTKSKALDTGATNSAAQKAVTASDSSWSSRRGLRPSASQKPPAGFFDDCPWLQVPQQRLAHIIEIPVCPSGGLLGGMSLPQKGPPKSKLAALAAARRKENRELSESAPSSSSASLLDKLTRNPDRDSGRESLGLDGAVDQGQSLPHRPRETRKYIRRKPQEAPVASPEPATAVNDLPENVESSVKPSQPKRLERASPSAFANVILGPTATQRTPAISLGLRALTKNATSDANSEGFTGPSPDDKILKAQNRAKDAQPPKKAVKKTTNGTDILAQDLENISVSEQTPKVKSKNLDVVAEFSKANPKKSANFVVIGHVDAGKSTLMGRLLHDLQVVDQRTIEKYRREAERMGKGSFALAWVLDQGTEERTRGVTIDIANFNFETDTTQYTILDAPGHRDFVPNMIAGASQADFAILVIDASTGNFESGLRGQTKEHALLVRSMGVQRIITAVNKLDTVQWSKERFDEISQQIAGFLTGAGFQDKNLAFVPCSGLTGDNIVHRAKADAASWYIGGTLINLLEASEPGNRAIENPLRLTIDNVFRGGVQNPLSVSGRLDAGTVQIGEKVLILPASHTATIKAIELDNEPKDWAVAGQIATLHLTDVDPQYLKSGDVICPPSAPVPCVRSFNMKLLAFEHIMPTQCEVHRGRSYTAGRVAKLEAVLDKATGAPVKGKKPRLIKPGVVARLVVELEEAVPLETGNRVILRAEGETIGAGLVQ